MSNYRWADKKTQWFQDDFPGSVLNLNAHTMVATIHTTETAGWPGYEGGATAPNYTGMPPIGLRRGKWRAHFPDERSSRALKNLAGGVETNTLNDVQFELIGTCDPAHAKTWGKLQAGKDYVYWPNANKRQLRFLGNILASMHVRHGLQLKAPKQFLPYPKSYGNNGVRMSFAEWRNATGVVGHQHIPENDHGDPGNINIAYALWWARVLSKRWTKRKK
jgi:hypothetical protein